MRYLLLMLVLACSQPSGQAGAPVLHGDFDILIRNGEVIDGSGAPRVRADIGIRGDTIIDIGDLSHKTATTTIDAKNQVVTPGFIDLLGHSEGSVLIDPHVEGKVRQGVTTEVTGEGHSPGPINDAMAAEINRTKIAGFPEATWRSLADYMKTVEKRGSAINFAFYIGAANPREIVIGTVDRDPTPAELQQMERIVEQAVHEGAVGMTTALIYPPGRFAKTPELIALAKHTPSYWTHLRSESGEIISALDEAFRIGREAHVPVNIFHIKVGGTMRGHMPEVVAKIEEARKSGLDVAGSIYPYTATSTDLISIVPAWAQEKGYLAFVASLKDPATRARVAQNLRIADANGILVRNLPNAPADAKQKFERKRLDEIARLMNTTPQEAVLRLFEMSSASPIAIYFGLREDDLRYVMKQPWVAVGSDSGAVVGVMREVGAHPRAYGTFPRILGYYARDQHLFTLEEAVRKMTSLAASRAGFKDRGLLRKGMKADVVVFDPKTIRDVSTYEDPHHFSEGISNVIVNGTPVLQNGAMTPALPGRVLRSADVSSAASGRPARSP
ncbi:MAG TPA: D-aminoacylase [Thermoanaerobaculia bacterium]|nr:D-aminoacylase [Thermoanaerobaculia bacterium]